MKQTVVSAQQVGSAISENSILKSDSYKVSHWRQYPAGTTNVYSYLEARKGGRWPRTVFFGLQYLLKRHFVGQRITREMITEAREFFAKHFGRTDLFNEDGWNHILQDHNGRYPVSIKAPREGSIIPEGNVLLTIENTCPKCFWLTNYLETLLVQVWYPITVATTSRACRDVIKVALEKSADNLDGLAFKLHDFGYRGVSTDESAAIGGMAHLTNFMGTDTMIALDAANRYYGVTGGMAGFSVPAAEHSTITSWGKDHEADAYRNMITQFGDGLVACVSDSYDIYNACDKIWGVELYDAVQAMKGTLIVRPDSGDPVVVVPKVLDLLWRRFGGKENSKGYIVLDKVRVIQGDGVNPDSIQEILQAVMEAGFSADNLAFGMGGALLQKLDRDTQRFAMKCSAIKINGKWQDVYKQPATDPTKNSKRGRMKLVRDGPGYATVLESGLAFVPDQMVEVFRDGELLSEQNFDEIRKLAASQ